MKIIKNTSGYLNSVQPDKDVEGIEEQSIASEKYTVIQYRESTTTFATQVSSEEQHQPVVRRNNEKRPH